MQFSKIILTLMASSAMVMAAPEGSSVAKRGCPAEYEWCGECNGTSCKIALTNWKCSTGSCTKQSGAGDGTICGIKNVDTLDMKASCPGV